MLTTSKPATTTGFAINPGKGWMLMMPGPDRAPFADWPWVSLIYHRVCWNTLEPEEGRFDWGNPAWEGGFKPWIAAGFPVGLDVCCENPHGGEYCTPKWVRDAGCNGRIERRNDGDQMSHGKVMERWCPDYTDPIFQEKLANFLTALAARYDADPAVEYVTLRSYAAWGEWYGTAEPDDTLNWMVDLHCRLFRQTPLIIPESCPPRWPGVILPAIDRGIGVRKDGLGGPTHPGEHALFDRAHHRAPVMLEFWGARDYLRRKGWDVLFDKEECIQSWHASRVNMGFPGQARQWVENEPEFLDRMAARMGYGFRIHEAWHADTLDRQAASGEERLFPCGAWWRNDGVAPYTRNGAIQLTLRAGDGQEHLVHEDCTGPNQITPIGHYRLDYRIELPADVAPGTYEVLIGMIDRFKGVTRPIRLAHEMDAKGRVHLGTVAVR